MWPLDLLARRKYERQYNAAITVFLGAYRFQRLNADERSRVEAQVTNNYDKSIKGPKLAEWQAEALAAERAAAMQQLGIDTGVPGVLWDDLFAPWRGRLQTFIASMGWAAPNNFGHWNARPSLIALEFRPMAEATQDARDFLRRHGVAAPEN